MKRITGVLLGLTSLILLIPQLAFAAENAEVAQFSTNTLNVLVLLSSLFASLFLIKGGYSYITSSGNPQALESAKKTIRNALIGLVLVIAASTVSSLLTHAFTTPTHGTTTSAIALKPLDTVKPQDGLTQTFLDSVEGFLQNFIQSATKPITNGLIQFLSSTPSVVTNPVVFNFWLVILGITDSLFAIIIALLGFHFMSASTLGFEEIELKHVLSRIVIAFIGANMSIFLIEWIINLSNTLVSAVLHATNGIANAWVLQAFNPADVSPQRTSLVVLFFMVLFILLAVILLLFYISRLIIVALGAVLSPLVFLLWALPQTAQYTEVSVKTYLVTIFVTFVHVVTIQLASAFLSVTNQPDGNSLIAILVAIGLFFTLLKIPGTLVNFAFYTTSNHMMKKIGGQVLNVITAQRSEKQQSVTVGTYSKRLAEAREVAL